MERRSYGVIILNYNTSDDCKKAVKSIKDCATTDDYMICVVDGGSSKEGEADAIRALSENDDHVISLILADNKGYAFGNDEGFRAIKAHCNTEYTVIMNPDVIVNTKGTIEGIISGIEAANKAGSDKGTTGNEVESGNDSYAGDSTQGRIAGGQPLVATVGAQKPANEQINIRTAFSYKDFLISNFWLTRRTHKKAFEAMTYVKERPYKGHIEYEVPYGAFFVIKSDIFEKVGLFDPETFLYAEEFILGYKIKQLGKCFLLFSEYTVDHYQGKASGSHGGMSLRTLKNTMDAVGVYMRKYLKVSPTGIRWYRCVCYINRYTEWIEHLAVGIVKALRGSR